MSLLYGFVSSSNVNASITYRFCKQKASLTAYCNDISQQNTIAPQIDFKGLKLTNDYSCYRTVGISFTYSFGGYRERKHQAVDTSRFK